MHNATHCLKFSSFFTVSVYYSARNNKSEKLLHFIVCIRVTVERKHKDLKGFGSIKKLIDF